MTTAVEPTEAKYEFDAEFEGKIVALALRSDSFMRKASHLLKPEYFVSPGNAQVLNMATRFFGKYRRIPDSASLVELVKDDLSSKVLRKEELPTVKAVIGASYKASIAEEEYVSEKVAAFARNQAVGRAIVESADLYAKGKLDEIAKRIKQASEIGLNEEGAVTDYFARIEARTEERLERASGKLPPTGISTGVKALDDLLLHKGWGKKELVSIMGGAKKGKTTALINFAKNASMNGHNVLYVSLEVSSRIIEDRLDACISDVEMSNIGTNIHKVRMEIEEVRAKAGAFLIHEYPPNTMTANMLLNLIDKYKSKGITFDLIAMDYADIMAPNFRYNDPIANSKSIYEDLRAVAVTENVAILTATQSNREGYKSTVAKAEHASEDFNKVRTVDLLLSINSTEEEQAEGKARLYFAASRNQKTGITVFLEQNLSKMQFINKVLGVE
jgi:replicative DNA helicase